MPRISISLKGSSSKYRILNDIVCVYLICDLFYIKKYQLIQQYESVLLIQILPTNSCQSTAYTNNTSMETEKEQTVNKCPACPLNQPSHIVMAVACCVLIAFALASGIALFVNSQKLQNVSGLSGLTLYIMVVSITVSAFAVGAVVCSWKKITWYLHFYEFICLLMFVAFVLTLIAVVMINKGSTASSTSCYTPSNYFQFKMLQVNDKAQSLLCSSTCPCPTYTTVQQCPTWQSSPYDLVMQQLQSQFMCTGWCSTGSNRFMFTTGISGAPISSCQSSWLQWVIAQWRAVIGCLTAMLLVLFSNVMASNIRILAIWKQEQSEDKQEQDKIQKQKQ